MLIEFRLLNINVFDIS